jgi:hypothetical protein
MGYLAMGKCKDKTTKSIYCQEKTKPQIYKARYKRLLLHDVQTCNEIFETTCKPKKATLKTLFLKDLSTENLVTLCKLLATKIAKLLKKLDATLGE